MKRERGGGVETSGSGLNSKRERVCGQLQLAHVSAALIAKDERKWKEVAQM